MKTIERRTVLERKRRRCGHFEWAPKSNKQSTSSKISFAKSGATRLGFVSSICGMRRSDDRAERFGLAAPRVVATTEPVRWTEIRY